MTTAEPPTTDPGSSPAISPAAPGVRVEGAGVATLTVTVVGGLIAALGALVGSGAQVVGALAGTALVVAFFCFGAYSINLVAAYLPSASMLVALMTYTLQVLLLALTLVGVSRSGLVPDRLDATWLGVTVIVLTVMWTSALVLVALRSPRVEAPA